jgi:plasmid stability protein
MSTIRIRDVPEELHRRLKARAAVAGKTLSDYVPDELRICAGRPTMTRWLAEVEGLPAPAEAPAPAAEVIADVRRR